jgi:diguanylate cyclase (GGDEF)-like protein/PAS domain S-box-containing protein
VERLFESILDELVDRVCRYRLDDTAISYCNRAWAGGFGREPADLVGTRLDQLLSGDELDGLRRHVAALQGSGGPLAQEVHRVVDGQDRWEHWIDRLVVGADGAAEVLAVGRDVTDRVVAEARVRDAEASMRAALDALTTGVLVCADDGRVLHTNPALAELVSPVDGVGALVDAVRGRQHARSADAAAAPWSLDVTRADGSTRHLEIGCSALRFGGHEASLVTVRDVTDWWDAQQRLAVARDQARALLDHLPVPVIAREGDDTIVYANAEAARFYDRAGPGELVGRSTFELVHPDDAAEMAARLQEVRPDRRAAPLELRHLRRDGEARLVELRAVDVAVPGAPARLAVLRDITDEREAFDALAASERRLNAMFDAVHDGIVAIDADGAIVTANRAAADAFGAWDVDNLLGATYAQLLAPFAVDPGVADLVERIGTRVLDARETIEQAVIGIPVGSTRRWFRYSIIPLLEWGDERSRGAVASFRDITTEHELQTALTTSEARFRALADTAPIGIAILQPDGSPEYGNPTLFELMGIPPGSLDAATWTAAVHPEDRPAAVAAWRRAAAGSRHEHVAVRYVQPSGETRHARTHIVPLPSGGLLTTHVDLTERHVLEQRLAHDATHDHLTGLANRALLLDRLDTAVARAPRDGSWPAVLFCDLDRFKAVNDEHGHEAGDDLLRQVAQRLTGLVRGGDTVARLGGDEFVVLCNGIRASHEIDTVAARVLRALHAPFLLASGVVVDVGVSIGIAEGHPGVIARDLLRTADRAVYAAKRAGRGTACRTPAAPPAGTAEQPSAAFTA